MRANFENRNRTFTGRHLLILAIALSALAIAPAVGLGATFTVTTTTDPALPTCPSATDCSLRGAITAAVDGDIVTLTAGTYIVSQGQILVDHGITIQGAGISTTTVDASSSIGSHRVFKIRGLVHQSVILQGLSITGGRIDETNGAAGGGAIANNTRATLYLRQVRIYGNSATVDAGNDMGGGGVRSVGSVIMSGSTIEANAVIATNSGGQSGGGGVLIGGGNGNLTITDSSITGNTVTVDAVDAVALSQVTSNDGGGGVHVNGNDLILTSSIVSGNTVTSTNSYGESGGGGVYVDNGDIVATDSTISSNVANVTTTTDPTRIASNQGGGGIYQDGHDITLSGTTLAGNTTTVIGETTPPLTGEIPYATNGGGAIYQFGNRLAIANSTLSGNVATVPATARSGGGAIFDDGNATSITNTTIAGNTANVGPSQDQTYGDTNGGGGILFVTVRDGIDLANATIAGNAAPQATGGGILAHNNIDSQMQVSVTGSIIATNSSGTASAANCATAFAVITSRGYNLADDTANSCGFTATGDLIAAPQLGALQANGGATATMALAATSPAVHAGAPTGCTSALGGALTTDQRGVTRPQPAGSRCDIGAYELALPLADTAAATDLGSATARLNGTATNADALAGSAHFDYGKTTKYGKETSAVALSALGSGTAITASLASLKAGTYHFRLVTRNAVGVAYGADRTFTVPVITILRLSASPTAITTRIRVNGPGTLNQVALRGSRKACTVRAKPKKASTFTLVCRLNASTRAAIRTHALQLRLTTTFTSADRSVTRIPSVIAIRRLSAGKTSPVTG